MSARRVTRARSAQFRHEDGESVFGRTRQSSQRSHSRKPSNATTISRSTVSPNKRDRRARSRMVRDSLLGSHVQPMAVDQRAELLAGVAGDCVAKVLAAGFERGEMASEQAEDTWNTFQALRKTYFFGDDAPSIIFYKDIIHLLPHYTSSNHQALARAVELCNLATFAYIIFKPDYASRLAPGSKPSRKGKERARDRSLVEKRNAVLLNIWEKYWQIIPGTEKASEEAMRMWLALATQIVIHYQSFEVDPSSGPDANLPQPSREVWDQIFHPSAIARFGQWDLPGTQSTDGSGIDGMTQEIVEGRWAKAIAIRANELSRLQLSTLIKRYPYDEFRRNMFAYLDSDIVGAGAYMRMDATDESAADKTDDEYASSATETQRFSILTRRSTRHRSSAVDQAHRAALEVTEEESEPGILADAEEDTDMEAAEASVGGVDYDEPLDDYGVLDREILADVVREMESEYSMPERRENRGASQGDRARQSTPQKRKLRQQLQADDDWEVRDGATPRALTAQHTRSTVFNFATRQAAAVRVDWDSQSPARHDGDGSNAYDILLDGQEVDSIMPDFGGAGQGDAPAHDERHAASQPISDSQPRTRGPLFPFRGNGKADSRTRSGRIPSALREASVPLIADNGLAEDEEAVEGESQDRPFYDAAEDIALVEDEDDAGQELLPVEVLNRRFLPHRARAQAAAQSAVNSNEVSKSMAGSSGVIGTRHALRVVTPQPSLIRIRTDEESSDDGTDLLPPEIRLQRDVRRGGPGPVGNNEIAQTTVMTDPAAEDDDVEDDLLPAELAKAAITSEQVLRSASNVRVTSGADDDMDGNEFLPLEAIRQNQLDASRPAHIGRSASDDAGRHDEQVQLGGPDMPLEEIVIDEMPRQRGASMVPSRSASNDRNGQLVSEHGTNDVFGGGDNPFVHNGHEDSEALALDLGVEESDVRSSSRLQAPGSASRDRRDIDENGFVVANEDEAEEDRLLLQEIDQNRAARRASSQLVDVKPFIGVIPRFQARSRSVRDPDIDLYMVDDDGSPLETNETYRIPPDHVPRLSRLHGQVAGQSSAYSRLSGKKRWTEEQTLLLYRTLQKVPLDVAYPLRVVWYLHGEHGAESQKLEDFNPQHMKDKMVTLLRTRTNNRLPVEGRARMYLPKTDARRQEYDQELLDWEEERKKADRAARDELDRLEAERKAAEEASDEDAEGETDNEGDEVQEDEVEQEGEDAVQPASRSSRSRRSKRKEDADGVEDVDEDDLDGGDDDDDDDDGDDVDGDDDDNDGADARGPGGGGDVELENVDEGGNDNGEAYEPGAGERTGSRSSRTRNERRSAARGQSASKPSKRGTRPTQASQQTKPDGQTSPASRPKRKRGRPRKSGTHEDDEAGSDAQDLEAVSERTVRSTASRGRLMAEVVVPSRAYATRSQAKPSVPNSASAGPQRARGPKTAAKRSTAAKPTTRSRAITSTRARSPPASDPIRDPTPDSEREIDGLIDGEGVDDGNDGARPDPEDVGMPIMSDLESEEGDHMASAEPLLDAGAGDGPASAIEPASEGDAKAAAKAEAEAEAVRRAVVQRKVLEGAD